MRRSWLGALALSLGCFSDAPTSSTDTDVGTTTTMSSTSDGESNSVDASTSAVAEASTADETASSTSCDDGSMCVGAPEGWMGPFVFALVAAGSEPPECAAPYEILFGVPLHADLLAGSVDCNCECNQLGPEGCHAEILKYEGAACSGVASSTGLNNLPGTCVPTAGVDSVDYNPMPVADPMCTSSMGRPEIVAPSFEHDVVLCGLTGSPSACDDGICVPERPEPFTAVCIAQQGDVECPGDFADAHAVFVGVDDERECTCSCDAVAADCSPTIHAATDDNCNDIDAGVADCVDTSSPLVIATTWFPASEAQCNPVQAIAGDVVTNGAHTLCCRT